MESLQKKMMELGKKSCTFEKKLGLENAKKVLNAFSKDPQHFGFIKVTEKELANLTSLYSPSQMALGRRDVFNFRAGAWVVLIVVNDCYIEVNLVNPYDINEGCFTTSDI